TDDFLGFLPFRNVLCCSHETQNISVLIPHSAPMRAKHADFTVWANDAVFRFEWLMVLGCFLNPARELLAIIRVHDVEESLKTRVKRLKLATNNNKSLVRSSLPCVV